jgi:hypothetical protein
MKQDLQLWWLRILKRRSDHFYSKHIVNAKGTDKEFLTAEAIQVRQLKRDEILSLRSIVLSDKAESLGIPVAPISDWDAWEEGLQLGTVHLRVEAQAKLLSAIRNERREQWSTAAFILKEIVTPIIGVLGAIMGILSLLHAFGSR